MPTHTWPAWNETARVDQPGESLVDIMVFAVFLVSRLEPEQVGAGGAGMEPPMGRQLIFLQPFSLLSAQTPGLQEPPFTHCTWPRASLVALGKKCMDTLLLCDFSLFRKTGIRAKSSPKSASSGVPREEGLRSKRTHKHEALNTISTNNVPYLILAYWWFRRKD